MHCILLDITKLDKKSPLGKFTMNNSISIKKGYKLAVVIEFKSKKSYDDIHNIPVPDRYNYLNSTEFINSVTIITWLIAKRGLKKIFILDFDDNKLKEIIYTLIQNLPNRSIIVISSPLTDEKLIRKITTAGFSNPRVIDGNTIRFERKNDMILKFNTTHIYDKVLELKYHEKNTNLVKQMKVVISPETLDYLQYITFRGRTINKNNKTSQKEVGGALQIQYIGSGSKYVLIHDPNKIIHGDEERINIPSSYFSFHTHPHEAYISHNVTKGWPSPSDYIAFIRNEDAIAHFVIAKEGIYTISRSKELLESNTTVKQIVKYIPSNYRLDKEKHSIINYVNTINNLKLDGNRVIKLEFMRWGKNMFKNKSLNVFYKININI